jgi:heat shock protein HslJ/phosphoserine phosphatase
MISWTQNLLICGGLLFASTAAGEDPLPAWNDGKTKASIVSFVEKVTEKQSPDFVPPSERIATFDNDGCLWSEQPMYVQAAFIFDRIRALAPQNLDWQTTEPFASVLRGDLKGALDGGHRGILEMAMATHSGMTSAEFESIASEWIRTARHPKTDRLYTEMVYQPMLELLNYLRANGFKTFIVSGGGIEFMRPWTERVYGIPREQVVGSSIQTKFEVRDGIPVITRLPELNFIDDKEGKPVGIAQHIGKRPIFAAGNSDGDFQMLQWTTAGEGMRFGLIIHHTDGDREVAYDRESSIGKLDRALDEGPALGWTFVDMKQDWNQIFPPVKKKPAINPKLIGKWLAEDIAGQGVIDRAQSTIEIRADGSVGGSTAVNRYNGMATIDGDQISFGPLATTRMAGPAAVMDQESKFTKALAQVARFRIDPNGLLYLIDADGEDLIRFSSIAD